MKKKSLIFLFLFFYNCSPRLNYINENKIIKYGTKEFENFEVNATIKKEQAWAIQKEITDKVQVHVTHWLFFVIGNKYVFTTVVDNNKMKTELNGISVNSETGEIKYEKSETMVKYEDVFNGDNEKFPFKLKRKYRKTHPNFLLRKCNLQLLKKFYYYFYLWMQSKINFLLES